MTEAAKPKREFKNRYVRINKVVELYNSGITEFEALIEALKQFELSIPLRKGIKVERDQKFYSKSVYWCLKTAAGLGKIQWTEFKKPRAKRVAPKAVEVVNNTEATDGIPTL